MRESGSIGFDLKVHEGMKAAKLHNAGSTIVHDDDDETFVYTLVIII